MYTHNEDVRAAFVQQGDQIHNHFVAPAPEHRRIADTHLRARRYEAAVRSCRAALDVAPDDERVQFLMALGLLTGRRPHRHRRTTLRDVLSLVRADSTLPEAVALRRLVVEDHGLRWRAATELPTPVRDEIDRVAPERAVEITDHVPAPEALVWQALRARGSR